MSYQIAKGKCVACGACMPDCPQDAITSGTPHQIDSEKCIDCGACEAACPEGAVSAG